MISGTTTTRAAATARRAGFAINLHSFEEWSGKKEKKTKEEKLKTQKLYFFFYLHLDFF